jgi:hypothetical protein
MPITLITFPSPAFHKLPMKHPSAKINPKPIRKEPRIRNPGD